jgi:hypothetical protein
MSQSIGNIRNAFTSCGFIRTLQSGSIDDLTTLPTGGFSATRLTYDIFAFNDSWQATHPLFIRVRYFTGTAASPPQPGLECYFSMGTAHDSSGSFTGVSTLTEITNTANWSYSPVQTNQPIYASGDGSYMALSIYGNSALTAQLAVFERFYDANGLPTGSGFHMVGTNNNSTAKIIYSQACYHGQAPPVRDSIAIPCLEPTRNPSIYNGNLLLGMIFPFIGKPMNPSPNILIGDTTTFPTSYLTSTYTMYGTARTYIPLTSAYNNTNSQIFTNTRFLLRYE